MKFYDTKREYGSYCRRIIAPFRRDKPIHSEKVEGQSMIRGTTIRITTSFAASCALAIVALALSTIFLAPQASDVKAQRLNNDGTPYFGFPSFAAPGVANVGVAGKAARRAARAQEGSAYQSLVQQHAAANGLPVELVHRVIMRESRYNPRAVSKGNYGMMQIRLGTARAMGYQGGAEGLLDANTNMTFAVKYLAGAYRAAGGNHDRAVMNYARGYYYQAKAQGFSPYDAPGSVTLAARGSYALAGEPAVRRRGVDVSAARATTAREDAIQ
jgi:soluble lytic murein transglycosylase-like protein